MPRRKTSVEQPGKKGNSCPAAELRRATTVESSCEDDTCCPRPARGRDLHPGPRLLWVSFGTWHSGSVFGLPYKFTRKRLLSHPLF